MTTQNAIFNNEDQHENKLTEVDTCSVIHAPDPAHTKESTSRWNVAANQAVSATLHICIMVGFEIFLFFQYIIPIEKEMIKEQVEKYIRAFRATYYNHVPPDGRQSVATWIQYTPEIEDSLAGLRQNYLANQSKQERHIWQLQIISFYMLGGVLFIFTAFIAMSRLNKQTLHWKPILSENAGMLIGLGCFQFMFFTVIVLHFSPISEIEIQYWVAKEVYNTLR